MFIVFFKDFLCVSAVKIPVNHLSTDDEYI